MVSIPDVPGAYGAGPNFWEAFDAMIRRNNWNRDALVAVMRIETGSTFQSDAGWRSWSPKRTATGLIQFIESTARSLGVEPSLSPPIHSAVLKPKGEGRAWATWTLMGMNPTEQLDWVERYYRRAFRGCDNPQPADYYVVAFGGLPGQSDDTILASDGSPEYEANQALDRDSDGEITVNDLASFVEEFSPKSWHSIDVTEHHIKEQSKRIAAGKAAVLILITGAATWIGYALLRR